MAFLAYGIAVLAGLALALHVFPLAFLFPAHGVLPPGDATQHAAGQRYFIGEPWSWPPLWIRGIQPPQGVPLGFMDSIPLLAVPLKLLRAFLPPAFHGIGLWYGIAWVLQPVAAVFLIRAAGERRLLPCLAFAALAVLMPAWWMRFGHAALTGHFLLLTALGLYFLLIRPRAWGAWIGAVALVVATLLTHPYLAAMVVAVVLAAPATLLLRAFLGGQAARRPALLALAAGLGCAVLLVLLSWMLGYTRAEPMGGYGEFSLNILSPVWPYLSGLLPNPNGYARAPGQEGWEGYNWLGVGVILAVLLGVATRPGDAARALGRHAGLVLVLLALTLIGISTRVGFGDRLLADLGNAPSLLQQFRVSGRLFWPVAYALALGGVLLIARWRSVLPWAAALVALPLLQWVDTRPVRAVTMAGARSVSAETAEGRALRQILPSARLVTLLPNWYCWVPDASAMAAPVTLDLVAAASERAVPVNDAYVGRRLKGRPPCYRDQADAAAPLSPGEVRIFLTPDDGDWPARRPPGPHECRRVENALFCRRPGEPMPDAPPPALAGGLSFVAGGNGIGALASGWRVAGGGWTWTGGDEATLAFTRDAALAGPIRLSFELVGFAGPGESARRVAVQGPGGAEAEWSLPHMAFSTQTLDLPPGEGRTEIRFRFGPAASPKEIGMSADDRRLAVGIRSLRGEPR